MIASAAIQRTRRWVVTGAVMVIATMPIVFLALGEMFGDRMGWVLGFVVYWLVWGFSFPIWLLGRARVWQLLRTTPRQPGALDILLLLGPPIGSLVMGLVPASDLSFVVVVAALGFALVNGTAEEILWRGVFITAFPNDRWWGLAYPSLAFGLWHLAPQTVNPAEGGPVPFALAAVFLGLVYGLVAQRTGSVRWPALSHIITDMLALGTFVELLQ